MCATCKLQVASSMLSTAPVPSLCTHVCACFAGVYMFESAAIIKYLEDTYAEE